ncbi:MAG TPA: hypothetical protein VN174_04640 [Candidatus Methanoperedens sp.]|nr:hypothetical protein [Candidatus Methanoperedens sp.]
MKRKGVGHHTFIFVGLSVIALSLFLMSRVASEVEEDSRILGVHNLPTATPTPKPTATPTPKPTTSVCIRDGLSTSNPGMCCSGKATYVWSSYVCGEVKPTATPTPKVISYPTVKVTPRPTLVSTDKMSVSPTPKIFIYPTPTISFQSVTPTKTVKSCATAVLDVDCIGIDGKTCKWFKGTDCVWVCNRNCVEVKKCQVMNLGTSCTNDKGQSCQQRQNSDCSTSCDLNCKNSVVTNFSSIFRVEKKNACNFGVDHNKDGVINSLDIVFCNKKSVTEVTINSVVDRVKTNIPLWFEWITAKFGW